MREDDGVSARGAGGWRDCEIGAAIRSAVTSLSGCLAPLRQPGMRDSKHKMAIAVQTGDEGTKGQMYVHQGMSASSAGSHEGGLTVDFARVDDTLCPWSRQ